MVCQGFWYCYSRGPNFRKWFYQKRGTNFRTWKSLHWRRNVVTLSPCDEYQSVFVSRNLHQNCLSIDCSDLTKQDLASQASSSCTSFWSPPSSSISVKHGPCLLTLKEKGPRHSDEIKGFWKLPRISYLEHKTNDWVREQDQLPRGTDLLRQLSRDGNLHGSSMSYATTASPNPSFRAPWRVGDAMVGRVNAGWTTSKSGHPCPCQNCLKSLPAEKVWRRSLLNRPSCPPPHPLRPTTQSVKEMNWTELCQDTDKSTGYCRWLSVLQGSKQSQHCVTDWNQKLDTKTRSLLSFHI